MWVIQVAPSSGETTLLQAEMAGGTYVLCFTTDEKARAVIASLGVEGAWSSRLPVPDDAQVGPTPDPDAPSLVSAVCQVGAIGIIVDLDPATRRCAWSRVLTANA